MEHKCDKVKYKDNIVICTAPITHKNWVIYLTKFGITLYHIKYCPYCGVELGK